MDSYYAVVESPQFINYANAPDSGTRRHKPTKEEWNLILLPELNRMKDEGVSNTGLLQALLDEGYSTSLSTIERKLHMLSNLKKEARGETNMGDPLMDEILDEQFKTATLGAGNAISWQDNRDSAQLPQAIVDADFTSMDSMQSESDGAAGAQMGVDDQDGMLSQSAQDANDDVMSQISPEPATASLRSGCSRSIQESSDRTVMSEPTCASTLGNMRQTTKRAQKQIVGVRKDVLKFKLPPAVPSPGQKVEEWHNDAWRLRYSDAYWEAAKA